MKKGADSTGKVMHL